MDNKFKTYLFPPIIFFTLTAFCTLFTQEWLARRDLIETVNWAKSYSGPFLLNLTIHVLVLSFLIGLMGRLKVGLIFGAIILLFLALINAVKTSILHIPFFAWDLFCTRQLWALGMAMLPSYAWTWIISLGLVLLSLIILILYRDRKSPKSLKIRVRFTIMTGVLLCSSLLYWQSSSVFNKLRIQNIAWDQILNHHDNGFLLSFSMNISPIFIKKPTGYSQKYIENLLANDDTSSDSIGFKGKPVSLVIFMSESFSDLCGAPLKTNVEPMPNIKQLALDYPYFTLISPTLGGGTSLVEYETLTGLSNAFFPPGAIPYDHYIHSPIPSLPWILRQNGYRTIAVHPFYDWFWSRKTVYPYLGFEEFIAIDQFEGAAKRGEFISDESMVDKIIQVIDKQKGPFMVHAISMQNHGPFWGNRYPENEVTVSDNISDWLRGELEAYLTGVRDADQQLERLLKYLKTRDEPVICLFFGDHQPSFNAQLYSELGMAKKDLAYLLQLAQVPALIWANPKDLLNTKAIPDQFSPVYLSPVLLQQMGIPLPAHFRYLTKGLTNIPVLHRDFVCNSKKVISSLKKQRVTPYLKGLEILNYDVLFGSKFCLKYPFDVQPP